MASESLADKIAKKTFFSPAFQKSWAVHMQSFGPILEPAFANDYQTRIHLTAALNAISNTKIPDGLKKLQALQDKCQTDSDKAALLFFMGVCFEMANRREQMVECYTYANEYAHRFYMPYLKVAKHHMSVCSYDEAAENFRKAIDCFTASGLTDQDRLILGSAYTNYGSCLMMMHRYEDAAGALSTSRSLYPNAPGRAAAEAVLYAIQGQTQQMEQCLAILKDYAPETYPAVKERTDTILSRTNPLFYPLPLDNEKISRFWDWFAANETQLKASLDQENYEAAVTAIADQLLLTFPFLEEQPYIGLGRDEQGYILELHDIYMTAATHAFEELLLARPRESAQSGLSFLVVH